MARATPAQEIYVKARTEGKMGKRESAKLAYPDAKDPSNAAATAEKSPKVKMLIARYNISQMSMEASGLSFALNTAIVKNQVYDYVLQPDGSVKKTHVPAELALRHKASIELHKSFGFGRIKTKEGEDPFKIGEMTEDQLEDFILASEAELNPNKKLMNEPLEELPLLEEPLLEDEA